jgi:hypothetical protein
MPPRRTRAGYGTPVLRRICATGATRGTGTGPPIHDREGFLRLLPQKVFRMMAGVMIGGQREVIMARWGGGEAVAMCQAG